MQHLLATAQPVVEGNGGSIHPLGLPGHGICLLRIGDRRKRLQERGGDALPAVAGGDARP